MQTFMIRRLLPWHLKVVRMGCQATGSIYCNKRDAAHSSVPVSYAGSLCGQQTFSADRHTAQTRFPQPHSYGVMIGMASVKMTVTLGAQELEQIRSLVAEGPTGSVSGFVQHAVRVGLADVRGWGAMLAQALEETGGPLSDSERRFADSVLKAEPKRLKARRKE